MPINLAKGQKVDLTKKNPGLKNIMVGLGWDVNAFDSGADFDLDAVRIYARVKRKMSDGKGIYLLWQSGAWVGSGEAYGGQPDRRRRGR